MNSPVSSILRRATRKPDEPLNVLTCSAHEGYESALSRSGHSFYAFPRPDRGWDFKDRPKPSNYHELREGKIPHWLDIDVILCHNKWAHLSLLNQIRYQFDIPLISMEHTLPQGEWNENAYRQYQQNSGDINVFATHYSRESYHWPPAESRVVYHGVDHQVFKPPDHEARLERVISVVNMWQQRDEACGYSLWKSFSDGLPTFVLGDNPGLSVKARNLPHLVEELQRSLVFLNTSTKSNFPLSLIEGAMCECAIVSTATSEIPRVFTHNEDALLSNDPTELRSFVEQLIKDPSRARELGQKARQTAIKAFGMDRFISEWHSLLQECASINPRKIV